MIIIQQTTTEEKMKEMKHPFKYNHRCTMCGRKYGTDEEEGKHTSGYGRCPLCCNIASVKGTIKRIVEKNEK